MGHTMMWAQRDIVACLDRLVFCKTQRIALDNLFRQCLGDVLLRQCKVDESGR